MPRIAGQSAYYLAWQLDSYAEGTRRDPTMEPVARGLSPELKATVATYYARLDAPLARRAIAFTASWSERGRVLATEGDLGHGVQACINCHGPGGVGQPPTAPYLAGLDDAYIRAAVNAWKTGSRRNDQGQLMAVVARALAPEDVTAVARYYAGAEPPQAFLARLVEAGRPQLLPSSMTRSITVDTTAPEQAGSEGRAATTGGEHGLGQSGTSSNPTGAAAANEPDAAAANGPSPSGATKASIDRSASSGDATRGRALVASGTYGCTACHSVPGIRSPSGIVGPPLGGFERRPFIAGELPNTPDVLVAFLRDPPALVPATGMPNVGLTAAEARDLAAYLYTLGP